MQAIEILIEQLASAAVPSSEGQECRIEVCCINTANSTSAAATEVPAQTEQPSSAGEPCSGFSEAEGINLSSGQSGINKDGQGAVAQSSVKPADSQLVPRSDNMQIVCGCESLTGVASDLEGITAQFDSLRCSSEVDGERAYSNSQTSPLDACNTADIYSNAQQQGGPQNAKQKKSKLQVAVGKKPARNRECPCGSRKRYKNCCGPSDAAAARRQAKGSVEEPSVQGMPAIYV